MGILKERKRKMTKIRKKYWKVRESKCSGIKRESREIYDENIRDDDREIV